MAQTREEYLRKKRENNRKLRSNPEYRKRENEQNKINMKKLRSNPEYRKKEYELKQEYNKKYFLTSEYKKWLKEYYKKYRDDPKNNKIINQRQKDSRKRIKFLVLSHYSINELPECACCGLNSDINFLSIDHIRGKKNYPKKQQVGGHNLYYFLNSNDYPEGYQVLCYNCNSGKSNKNECPHKLPVNFENLSKDQIRLIKFKEKVFLEYSKRFAKTDIPQCNCCKEHDLRFLTIDHIHGRKSANHKRELVGIKLYRFLRDDDFPEGYQVLCYNCNSAKSDRGFCPHKRK